MRYKSFLLVLFLLFIPVVAAAQSIEPLLNDIDTYATQVLKDWHVPGMAIAIVKDDKPIMVKGFGLREIGTENTVDEHTLFAIASNSKAFTTASLAILVDEGKLKWNDSVSKYLPEFRMPDAFVTQEMTVRDLVCHRSGMDTFSGDLLWYDTRYSADEVLNRVRYLTPKSSFRSQYGYQNLMYIAAGKVIERISEMSWADFVQTRILTPAGMTRTTTSVKALKDNYALPHNESGGPMRALPVGDVDNSWGACGLNSSVSDLSIWMRLQLGRGTIDGKTIFSRAQSWEMWQPNTIIPISESAYEKNPSRHFMCYGLGFVLNDYHGRKIVAHSGGLDGMISQLALVPEVNLGVVILTNSESPASRIIRDRVLDWFLNVGVKRDWNAEALEAKLKADKAEADAKKKIDDARMQGTVPTLALDKYPATFQSQMYGDVAVTLENGHLVMRLGPAPNFVADLEHWHLNTFEIKWRESVHYNFPRGFVNFTIDSKGRPEQLIIDQPNSDFWFYELELKRKD